MISRSELAQLPEYSCSVPTGTTLGKRWRRNLNAYRPDRVGVPAEWVIGEYVAHPDPTLVGIRWTWAVAELGAPHRGDPCRDAEVVSGGT